MSLGIRAIHLTATSRSRRFTVATDVSMGGGGGACEYGYVYIFELIRNEKAFPVSICKSDFLAG